MTITEAVRTVLSGATQPMTAVQIHAEIVRQKLFQFKSAAAPNIVRAQIRRHCEGVSPKNGVKSKKYYKLIGADRYGLIPQA